MKNARTYLYIGTWSARLSNKRSCGTRGLNSSEENHLIRANTEVFHINTIKHVMLWNLERVTTPVVIPSSRL
jgi:hypothetical protein